MKRLNQTGYSLIEVMMGAALVGVLALSLAGISSMISNSMTKTKNTQDEFNIGNQIRTLFENEHSCRLALGGPTNYEDPATASPYAQTVNVAGNTTVILYQPVPANAGRPIFIDPSGSGTRTIYGRSQASNTVGNWVATAVTIRAATGNFAANGFFPAILRVSLKPDKEATTLGSLTLPDIRLTVELDGARRIKSCFPPTFGTDGQAVPVCPPLWAPSTQTIISGSASDSGPYLACRRIACPVGSVTNGWDTYGNAICVP